LRRDRAVRAERFRVDRADAHGKAGRSDDAEPPVTPRAILWTAAVVLPAAALAAWLWSRSATPSEPFIPVGTDAYVLAAPEPVPPFHLVAHDGRAADNAALRGRWTFLAFGFTHCPDVCPTTLAEL